MNEAHPRPSLVDRINRRAACALTGVTLVAIGVTAWRLHHVRSAWEMHRGFDVARLAVSSIAGEAVLPSEHDLQTITAASSDILAAAIVSPDNTVRASWPPNLGHTSIVPLPLTSKAAVPVTLSLGQARVDAWAAGFPTSSSDERIMVWLRRSSTPWTTIVEEIPLAAGVALLVFLAWQWFRSATHTLLRSVFTDLTQHMSDSSIAPMTATATTAGAWSETATLVKRFSAVRQELSAAHMRIASLEKQMERALQHHEKRYARTLEKTKLESLTDPLTGLYNRRFLDEELPKILADIGVRGGDITVVMIDLDHFKQHNDAHGHEAGDALLRFVGDLLRGATRETDYAVRYGGDEFSLIMPDTPRELALPVVERILKLFAQYASVLKTVPRVSMSAGLASSEVVGHASDGASLLKLADRALYQSKSTGKNRVTVAM